MEVRRRDAKPVIRTTNSASCNNVAASSQNLIIWLRRSVQITGHSTAQ